VTSQGRVVLVIIPRRFGGDSVELLLLATSASTYMLGVIKYQEKALADSFMSELTASTLSKCRSSPGFRTGDGNI
jgi:hypothetical protein